MKALIVHWLDNINEVIGLFFIDKDGKVQCKSVDDLYQMELELICQNASNLDVTVSEGIYQGAMLGDKTRKVDLPDVDYLDGVQELLYDFMINGRRIAGYIIDDER